MGPLLLAAVKHPMWSIFNWILERFRLDRFDVTNRNIYINKVSGSSIQYYNSKPNVLETEHITRIEMPLVTTRIEIALHGSKLLT